MKQFWKKFFFWDEPEKGAFFALILLLLGTWLVWTLFLLGSGFLDLERLLRWATSSAFAGQTSFPFDAWWNLCVLPLLFLGIVVYFFLLQWRLWHTFDAGSAGENFGKWGVALAAVWGAALSCISYTCHLMSANLYWDHFFHYIEAGAAGLPFWLTASFLLLLTAVLVTGKVCAVMGNFPFKRVFTLPVKILAGAFLLAWGGMVTASLILAGLSEKETRFLEKQFKQPLTRAALKEASFRSRKIDKAFWAKLIFLTEKDLGQVIFHPFAEFTPAQLDAWRKKFESLPEIAGIDRMLDEAPLPAYPWDFDESYPSMRFPDLRVVYRLKDYQVWEVRFALEKKDRAAILAALKRMDNLIAYVGELPLTLFSGVRLIMCADKRRVLEELLASGILTKEDLLRLKAWCRAEKAALPELERKRIRAEALVAAEWWDEWPVMDRIGKKLKIYPWRDFRFLLPQCWLIYEANRLDARRRFRGIESFLDFPHSVRKDDLSAFNYLAEMFTPPRRPGIEFRKAELGWACMEFFIDKELYRLEHGKFPEDLPLPVDPANGKKLTYTRGPVTVKKDVFDGPLRRITIRARQLSNDPASYLHITVTIPERGK